VTAAVLLPLVLLLALAIEAIVVSRCRSLLPIRIHVNGTRGKSTVVRYIVAGLRAGGKRTMGKITGVVPTVLQPDGADVPIHRRGAPRVQEQIRSIVRAARSGCDALVLECMSIDPAFQHFEATAFRPTVSVLTNVRDDHQEVLGEHSRETIDPHDLLVGDASVLITTLEGARFIGDSGLHAGARVIVADGSEGENDRGAGTNGNIRVALAACIEAGVPADAARRGILAEVKAQEHRTTRWIANGYEYRFLDAFAVNDTTSATLVVDGWKETGEIAGDLFVILNTRGDRPLRTRAFIDWLKGRADVKGVIITGTHRGYCQRALRRSGMDPAAVTMWGREESKDAVSRAARVGPQGGTFVGLMNIAGDGFVIRDAFVSLAPVSGVRNGH
jgi:poly-gamma-glutamate synthase PgsB/CapB